MTSRTLKTKISKNIKLVFDKNPQKLLLLAQEELKRQLKSIQEESVLLLFSGGSALDLLDGDFSNVFSAGEAVNLTFGVLDERFSKKPAENNFAQVMSTRFYDQAIKAGAKTIDTRVGRAESASQLADRFQQSLKQWRQAHPQGKIVITQGMGEDAHTSGMMPFLADSAAFEQLFQTDEWVVAYDAGDKDARGLNQRITTTVSFFSEISVSLLWILGENKQVALTKLFEIDQKENIAEAPVRVIYTVPRVVLFTDQSFS